MGRIGALFKSYRWPLLSAVLIGTSYIPLPPWAVLFCYAPLWLWLDEDASSRRQAFIGGWIAQFIFTVIGNHWIAYTATAFGNFPWPLSGLTLALYAGLIHLHIPLAALLTYEIKTRLRLQGAPVLFVAALTLALAERVWPVIFPWNLGYTLLWARVPILQWADVVGFWGLSSGLLLLNAWIAWVWQKRDDSDLIFKHVGIISVILVALMAGGVWKKREWRQTNDVLVASVIQANIGDIEKVYAEQGRGYQVSIVDRFVRLSQSAILQQGETQLLVWPETALPAAPDRPDQSGPLMRRIGSALAPYGRHILTGAYSRDPATDDGGPALTYNAVFLLNAQGEPVSAPYKKNHLLVFGEYLPLSERFPVLLEWLPFVANFGRGQGPALVHLPRPSGTPLRLGPQICYEGLFAGFTREIAKAGAEVLVNVTNDSWFGTPFEPLQHMTMTLARAIETRRPLIRSTNTGISTVMLASGDQLESSPTHEEWFGSFHIPYRRDPPQTFYVLYGHWDWTILLLALAGLLTHGWLHARSRSS